MKAHKIMFCIAAGKLEQQNGTQEVNWKYIDLAEDCADAMAKYRSCTGYHVVEFHIETHWDDDTVTRVPVFGGQMEKLGADGIWREVKTA